MQFRFIACCLLLNGSIALGADYSVRAHDAAASYAKVKIGNPDFPKDAMPLYTARLMAGENSEETIAAVDHMMDAALKAKLDPFNLHAIIHGERVGGNRWPDSVRAKFRMYASRWNYSKPIGVSLNYELMRDGAGWMAATIWPDLVDQAGNNAARIRQLCGARLRVTLANIPKQGSTEYDAPLYYGTDFMALRLLADFGDEEEVRVLAQQVLGWMLEQTGAHWNRGYAITTAGRAKYYGSQMVSPDGPGATTGMAWLVFGGDRLANLSGVSQCYWLAYDSPFVHSLDRIESWQAALPLPRSVLASVLIPSHGFFVRKQAWITDGYGLASQRTDGTSANSYLFKESRATLLRWVSDSPASTFFVFQENRRRPQEPVLNAFAYGENPYVQTLQHEGTLIGVYAVPESYGFWRMTAPFTTRGAICARLERDGWVFAHGGTVLFGFRSAAPAAWGKPNTREKFDPYVCEEPRNAWVIETSPVNDFAGGGSEAELRRFADEVQKRTSLEVDLTAPAPKAIYTNLKGNKMELDWTEPGKIYQGSCRIDGHVVDYESYPLLGVNGNSIYK